MLQLNNKTPFAATMVLLPDQKGIDTLFVMVKASFNIGPNWTLLTAQIPPVEADVYWAEPDSSSVRYASDFHIGKPCSDIVMMGLACAPGRRSVNYLDVSLSVGQVSKTIRVFGDRHWQNGLVSEPVPFETMPMVYERAFGGVHLVDNRIESGEMRNPLGCGFCGGRSQTEMDGVPLPNLEDPGFLISQLSDMPPPACFGFSAPGWKPRLCYSGTYDEAWQTQRAPFLPEDFDCRFFNMAHPDMIYPGYLSGGEAVSISGMHPNGEINFNLPRVELISQFKLGDQIDSESFNLETLIIEPNLLQLGMQWRAAYPCNRKALDVKEIQISMKH